MKEGKCVLLGRKRLVSELASSPCMVSKCLSWLVNMSFLLFPQVNRYESIIYRLGLQDKLIDYVKMDIEGQEIEFLRDVLDTSFYLMRKIKQLGIEIHPSINNGKNHECSKVKMLLSLCHTHFFGGFDKKKKPV